jgi:DNA-binding MarR family transcriptional regulator
MLARMGAAAGPLASNRLALDDARREARRKALLLPLQRLAGDFRERVRAGLRERGHSLQPAHSSVIVHLGVDGMRLTELASRAGATKQAMGKLVDELEAIGYLERVSDPRDGRAKLVRFSRRGRALLRDAGEIVDSIWSEYAALVGEGRLRALRDTLQLLVGRLDGGRGRAAEEEST